MYHQARHEAFNLALEVAHLEPVQALAASIEILDHSLDTRRDLRGSDDESEIPSSEGVSKSAADRSSLLRSRVVARDGSRDELADVGAWLRSFNAVEIRMQNPRGEVANGGSPERGGIVEQLRHDASGIRVPRVLDLDDAELSTLVDKHEICVPGSQRRLAADHDARPHSKIRKWDEFRISRQGVMKFSLGRQLGLGYNATQFVRLADQDVPGHLGYHLSRPVVRYCHQRIARPFRQRIPTAGAAINAWFAHSQVSPK
jgi:hypothetical protein